MIRLTLAFFIFFQYHVLGCITRLASAVILAHLTTIDQRRALLDRQFLSKYKFTSSHISWSLLAWCSASHTHPFCEALASLTVLLPFPAWHLVHLSLVHSSQKYPKPFCWSHCLIECFETESGKNYLFAGTIQEKISGLTGLTCVFICYASHTITHTALFGIKSN